MYHNFLCYFDSGVTIEPIKSVSDLKLKTLIQALIIRLCCMRYDRQDQLFLQKLKHPVLTMAYANVGPAQQQRLCECFLS